MNLKNGVAGFAIQAAKGAAEAQPAFAGPVGGGKLARRRGRAGRGRAHVGRRSAGSASSASAAAVQPASGKAAPGRRRSAACCTPCWAPIQTAGAPGAVHAHHHAGRRAAVVHGLRREGHRAQVDLRLQVRRRSRSSGRATARSRSRRRGCGLDVAWSDVAFIAGPRRVRRRLPQGHHLTSPRARPRRHRRGRRRHRAGRLGRDQAQPHGRHEVRPARADRRSTRAPSSATSSSSAACPTWPPCACCSPARSTATRVSADVPYGDFTLTFTDGADEPGAAPPPRSRGRPQEPDADPKGGPAELTLQGRCYGDPPLTATVINAVASY